MLNILLLVILFVLATVFRLSVFDELKFVSFYLHAKCMNLLPASIETQEILAALVCGHNFEQKSISQIYISTGLIHLFVVSGAHLSLIFGLLRFLFLEKLGIHFIFAVLFIYAGVCQFNPPVVRSLLALILLHFLNVRHRRWGNDYNLVLVGLICLILNPEWVGSLSLQMSWLAALCLELSNRHIKHAHYLTKQFPFYIVYYLTYLGLGLPQFAIVVLALVCNPFLEFILFPLALLVYAVPIFGFLFDGSLRFLNSSLAVLEFKPLDPILSLSAVLLINWILILIFHLGLHFKKAKS